MPLAAPRLRACPRRARAAPVLGVLAASLLVPGAPRAAAAQDSSLTAAMSRGLLEEGLVGAVWATVGPSPGVVLGAAGRRRADRPDPLGTADRVQVGSVAKTLIAVGILRLATEGRLSLDAPVASVLPRVPIENPWGSARPLRVRHLLDHTSGLDDARLWQLFNTEPTPDTPLAAGFDPDRLRLVLRRPPGDRFSYSNTGYGLLGLVIEAVTGERYEAHLDAHLLRPLGMTHSTFRFVTQAGADADSSFAMGHFEEGAPAPAVPTFLRPAMQFTTTAGDMARFATFLMGDGTAAGAPFVDPALLRAMGTPVGTEAARAGLPVGYALGLSTRDRHGVVGRCHAGNTVGYRAMLCVYPQERKAFFVSMNADDEDANYARLDSLLLASLAVAPRPAPPPAPSAVALDEWAGTYVPAPARFESFAYVDAVTGFVRATREGGRFVLAPFQAPRAELEPVGGALLRARGRTLPSHVLLATAGGTRAFSTGLQTYERIAGWRIGMLWISLAAGLLALLYVLLRGLARLARWTLGPGDPLFAPFLTVVAALLAGGLLARQSLLALGALTRANAMLAVVTAALPLAAAVGLWRVARSRRTRGVRAADAIALGALLQWTVVLAAWGLVPLRLWS